VSGWLREEQCIDIGAVNEFANLREVKISDLERYLGTNMSIPTARKEIHQLDDFDIITFDQSQVDKRVKLERFLKMNLDEFM
jgi:hypothetical protein